MHATLRALSFAEPAAEPVTVEECNQHGRITSASENDMVADWIKVARRAAEEYQFRILINRTGTWKLDDFPGLSGMLDVPYPPLSSVTSIAYLDANGDSQTLSASVYQVDTSSEPGRIAPVQGQTWPTTQNATFNTVTITFVGGYGSAASSVPHSTKLGIRKLVNWWMNHRDNYPDIPDEVYRIWDAERAVVG